MPELDNQEQESIEAIEAIEATVKPISTLKLKLQSCQKRITSIINFFTARPGLFKFSLLSGLLLTLLILALSIYFTGRNHYIAVLAGRSQALMINIISGEIFAGKLYAEHIIQQSQNKEQPLEAKQKQAYIEKYLTDEKLKLGKIVILVEDLGLSKSATDAALTLPTSFTLGFSPYGSEITSTIASATTKGFESLINLPLQPVDYQVNDPGPLAMLSNISATDNLTRLTQILSKSSAIKGVYTATDDAFSASRSNFVPIVEALRDKNLFFVFGNIENAEMIRSINKALSSEVKIVDVPIDATLDDSTIANNFLKLEQIATLYGSAVGTMHTYPISIAAAKSWYQTLDTSKYIVIPISILYSNKFKAAYYSQPSENTKN